MRNRIVRAGLDLVRRLGLGQPSNSPAPLPEVAAEPGSPPPAFSNDPDYAAWLGQHALTAEAIREAGARAHSLQRAPLISVIMPVYNPDPAYLKIALESVEKQIYPNWELCIAEDKSGDGHITTFLQEYAFIVL
jgi:hypothetical protein